MAIAKKFVVAPNAATRELWRVAESGELDELEDLLPQANINARNEHGMTALMRAAYHGRVQMVRALLEHGADPNLTRNDNFTALSLAAFFGHTEIVEMLMSYGASTDVATRYGTSPQMWAKARSFGDVAQCLQQRRPKPKPTPTPKPEPEPEIKVVEPKFEPVPLPAVKTLREPPEIWDLVHEAPRNFSAGSAFMARVGSITAGVALGVVAFVIVAAGIAGVWYWKQTRPQPVTSAPLPPVTNATTTPQETAPTISPVQTNNPIDVPSISVPEPVVRRNAARRSVIKPPVTETPAETATTAPPPPVAPKVELPTAKTGAAANKSTAPLSPQLISPPKAQQPKAKVIQWP